MLWYIITYFFSFQFSELLIYKEDYLNLLIFSLHMHQIYHYLFYPIVWLKYSEPRDYYGSVGSNTDSGSKIRVQCRDTGIFYLAFIIRAYVKWTPI
jgi:hypothetical protein